MILATETEGLSRLFDLDFPDDHSHVLSFYVCITLSVQSCKKNASGQTE